MYSKFIKFFTIISFLLCSAAIGLAQQKPVVFVSILPQKYFVEQLAGDVVDVEVMVPPGASPATYEPRPSQMAKLAKAKAYYSIGVPFEASWLPRLRSVTPDIVLVATDKGIQKRPIDSHADHHHTQNSNTLVRHAIADPHIWLSPPLVKQQVKHIAHSLSSLLPLHAEVIRKRLQQFTTRLDQLDATLHKTFLEKKGMHFMVFHPSWGYFADQYGLVQESVEFAGKNPKPAQLAQLVADARAENIHTVLVQPQFSKKSAELIAREIGGKVIIADPLASDWLENLQRVALLVAGETEK